MVVHHVGIVCTDGCERMHHVGARLWLSLRVGVSRLSNMMANDDFATTWPKSSYASLRAIALLPPLLRPCHLATVYTVAMRRYAMGGSVVTVRHSKRLTDAVHKGELEKELSDAVGYCTNLIVDPDWMLAVGNAAGLATPKEVAKKLEGEANTTYHPDEVKFGGVLGWLDLNDRVKPIADMDVGRMRWACEKLDETHKFSKILGDIVVRGDFVASDTWAPAALRRVEDDVGIDVVCLSLYWHRPMASGEEHPLKNLCRDLVFSAERVGQGLDLDIERFKRKVDEEKKRQVMGQSAWRFAVDCQNLVRKAESQRDGMKDADLLAKVLATRKELAKEWKSDTCLRYLLVAAKINDSCKKILGRWELAFQRNCLLDGITLLRAAAAACQTPEEFQILVQTLFWEQTCKLRRSIAPKGRGHATDATNAMRGILLRQALYAYCRQIFPKLADSIATLGTWEWFQAEYGMTETGHLPQALPNDSDEDPDTPGKGVCPSPSKDPSRFASKDKLTKFCTMVAKGRYDWGFASLGQAQGHAKTLDLSHESMRTVKAKVQEIWTDYLVEFPPEEVPRDAPGATLEQPGSQNGQGLCSGPTEVRASSRIESEHEYQMGLAAWGKQCEQAVQASVEDYINATVVLVQCQYETHPIENRLKKIPFMNEPGRKLFAYDSLCREPVNWSTIKRHKRSVLSGATVSMQLSQVGDESGDTLAVLKNIYLAFRTERPADHLSEDIVACIVPGRCGDSPINDVLHTAWKSMRALGNKHIGPKVGSIRVSQEDVLAQVYARSVWNRPPEHHLVFTYQANPSENGARKRMRYLKDNQRHGDTFFNEWPVPMYQWTQMPKVTTTEHDAIFALDTAIDEGEDDGSGAAMVNDLGDKVVPFPREFHVKLWQEMIHVFGIESAVLFMVGSGQSLLAFVLERKRAVGIVKNAQQKKLVKETLAQAVKTLGLAPDRRPPKPQELVAWESRRAVGGAAPLTLPKAGAPQADCRTGASSSIPPSATPALVGALAPSVTPPPAPALAGASAPTIMTVPPAPKPASPAVAAQPAAGAAAGAVAPTLAAFGSSALR